MNRSIKKAVWQAVLREKIGECMRPEIKRTFARFILKLYLPAVEPMWNEPATFGYIIKATHLYHRLMRDSGVLQEFTNKYTGSPIGETKKTHLECLARIADDNVRILELALDDPAGYLTSRNMSERDALEEFRVVGQDADDALSGNLTIGKMLMTRPQIILTTFWSFFTFGSRMKPF